jgi:hypothetical protein
MPCSDLAFLLRVAAELYYRTHRVNEQVMRAREDEAGQYGELADVIQSSLSEIDANTTETISLCGSITQPEWAPLLFPQLDTSSQSLVVVHEHLAYFPHEGVLPEAAGAMKIAFGRNQHTLRPSLMLGSILTALQFDFRESIRRMLPSIKSIEVPDKPSNVLQLPICDRFTPTRWPALAHEMGHAIDLAHGISIAAANSVASGNKLLQRWAGELCADLIAEEILGPAAILATVSLEYAVYPLTVSPSDVDTHLLDKRTHPPTKWRLQAMAERVAEKHGERFLDEASALYDYAWSYGLRRCVSDGAKRDRVHKAYETVYNDVIRRLCTELRARLPEYVRSGTAIARGSLDRCLTRLRMSTPIGSQGSERTDLRGALDAHWDAYERGDLTDPIVRKGKFQEVAESFRESPLPLNTLFLAGALRREEILAEHISGWKNLDATEWYSTLCGRLVELEDLLVRSLAANIAHTMELEFAAKSQLGTAR